MVGVCDNISRRQYIVARHHVSNVSNVITSCDNMGGGVGGMQWTARRWSKCASSRQHGRAAAVGGGRCAEVVEEAVVEVCDNPHLDKGEVAPTLKNIW